MVHRVFWYVGLLTSLSKCKYTLVVFTYIQIKMFHVGFDVNITFITHNLVLQIVDSSRVFLLRQYGLSIMTSKVRQIISVMKT